MGVILPNTGIQLPTLGSDAGVWDDETNTCWGAFDTHDHSPGKGVKVPTAGININADLTAAGFGLTNVGKVAFSQVAALTGGSVTLFVNTADHELYWRTAGGVNVKLTSGSGINVTLVGGILGDYASVGAQFSYDDANKRYTAKDGDVKWALVQSGGVRLSLLTTTSTLYTGIKANAGIAGSFDIVLPSALPGSQSLMQLDASGNVTASNTLPSNTNILLQGTGYVRHGSRTTTWPLGIGQNVSSGTPSNVTGGTGGYAHAVSSTISYPLGPVGNPTAATGGQRLLGVVVYNAASGGSPTYIIQQVSNTTGSFSDVSSGGTTSNASAVGVTVTSPAVLSEGFTYWLTVSTDGATTIKLFSVGMVTDEP